jgi:RHS repeat-associated protein
MDNRSRIAIVRTGPPRPRDGSPAVKYFLDDHVGSSHLTLDNVGGLVAREEYTPFGQTSFGGFTLQRYRFTGMERDEESSLNYHGARYYAPWLGRWISCDPSGLSDGPNLYQYVKGKPYHPRRSQRHGGQRLTDRWRSIAHQSARGGLPRWEGPSPTGAPPPTVDLAPPAKPLLTPPRTPPPRDRNRGVPFSVLGALYPAMMAGALQPPLNPALDDHPEWQRFQAGAVQEASAGAAHFNLLRTAAYSGIAATVAGGAVAMPAAVTATETVAGYAVTTYQMVGSAGLRLAATYPRLTMALQDLVLNINGWNVPRVGMGMTCAGAGAVGVNGIYRTAATNLSGPAAATTGRELATRAGVLQDQLEGFKIRVTAYIEHTQFRREAPWTRSARTARAST